MGAREMGIARSKASRERWMEALQFSGTENGDGRDQEK